MDLKTIGRSEEVKLYSKKEYQEAKSSMNEGQDSGVNMHNLVEGLGGIKNIRDVDNCYTRLRITVDNPEKVSKDVLQNNVNAKGVIINDQSVHVVYGLEVNRVRRDLDRYIEHNSGKEIDK